MFARRHTYWKAYEAAVLYYKSLFMEQPLPVFLVAPEYKNGEKFTRDEIVTTYSYKGTLSDINISWGICLVFCRASYKVKTPWNIAFWSHMN